jgi:7-carboxy-7-deazaguanine synthase
MPGPYTLKINEIFWSFQGEGLRAGFPSIFIRLSGCSLKCPYCDTRDAWNTGTSMTIDDILSQIETYRKKYPLSQIVLTGGEPMEQDLSSITALLKTKNFFISIETNGFGFRDLPIDWWTVSPKDVNHYSIHADLEEKINEIKLVVNRNLSVEVIKKTRAFVRNVPIFLQPDGTDGTNGNRYKNTFSLFRECQEAGIENIRCGVQLHKVYNVE